MPRDTHESRNHRLSIVIMFVLVGLLGMRSAKTTRVVLTPVAGTIDSVQSLLPQGLNIMAIGHRDSMIALAAPARRDPFREKTDPPKQRVHVSRTRREQKPKRQKLELGALLYDNINPTAQVSIDGKRSGWLRQGDVFQGWTVAVITTDTVTLTKGRDRIVLP